jgi:uncharacterized delta-60 repeat protein
MPRPARTPVLLLLVLALVAGWPARAMAASGDLDDQFSMDGQQTVDFGGNTDHGRAVQPAPGGKIVVAGDTVVAPDFEHSDLAVVRLRSNGTRDTAFSGDGRVTVDLPGDVHVWNGLDVMTDERIVAAGAVTTPSGDVRPFVVRFKANGALDGAFSGDGKLVLNVGPGDADAYDVIVQPDGKIVVAGEYAAADHVANFLIVRLHPDGSRDHSFGGDGVVQTPFGEGRDGAWRLARAGDGKLVVGGWTERGYATGTGTYGAALARYLPSGGLDKTFGGDGKVVTFIDQSHDAYVSGLDLFQGRVYASLLYSAGDSRRIAVLRYLSDGRLDLGFSSDGVAIV